MNSTPQAEAGLTSSPEGREYFLKLRQGQPFGSNGFFNHILDYRFVNYG